MLEYKLFACCARAECDPTHAERVAHRAAELTAWADVPVRAEAHGIAPLLHAHLRAAGVQIPPTVERQLRGLCLRHRWANRVRASVLRKILAAYDAAGIELLILKGAALAHLLYPQPGWRPMRDVDILVRTPDAVRAQRLLATELGFHAPPPDNADLRSGHHLDTASLHIEDLCVSVEVHYRFFDKDCAGPNGMGDLTSTPLPFLLGEDGPTAYTLGYEDMLWHLCQHMIQDASVFTATRFIWIADIVSFAERFVNEIDWDGIRRRYPLILNILSLLQFVTPLSGKLRRRARIPGGDAPRGIGKDFRGWPRSSLSSQRDKGYWRILRDTFLPPEWWLRLHYGLSSAQRILWYRWGQHPLEILGWITQLVREQAQGSENQALHQGV